MRFDIFKKNYLRSVKLAMIIIIDILIYHVTKQFPRRRRYKNVKRSLCY